VPVISPCPVSQKLNLQFRQKLFDFLRLFYYIGSLHLIESPVFKRSIEMNQTTEPKQFEVTGPAGTLKISTDDEIAKKFAMLFEVNCLGKSPTLIAKKYGYTKQRYFQIFNAFKVSGSNALKSQKTGPQHKRVRSDNIVKQVIRLRFHDPDANTEVIAQKLCQAELHISKRSVERIITDYGLQKKNLPISTQRNTARSRGPKNKN
jgi:transposase